MFNFSTKMGLHKENLYNNSLLAVYDKYKTNKTIRKICEAKHYLPSNKEWTNSVYAYNINNITNLSVKDKLLYNLLKSYFNLKKSKLKNLNKNNVSYSSYKNKKSNPKSILYLINNAKKNTDLRRNLDLLKNWQAMQEYNRLLSLKKTPYSKNVFYSIAKRRLMKLKKSNKKVNLKKTYLSLPDFKHYNNKLIITVSIYDREKIFLKKKVQQYYESFISTEKESSKNILTSYMSISKKKSNFLNITNKLKFYNTNLYYNVFKKLNYLFVTKHETKKNVLDILSLKPRRIIFYNDLKTNHLLENELTKIKNRLHIKYKKILMYKYYMLKLCFVRFKLNNSNLIGLKNIIRKIYNKKIILKIINLKYMYLDSNIVTVAITKKLRDRKKRILKLLKQIIKNIKRVSIVKGIWLENLNLNMNFSSSNDENKLLNIGKLYNIKPVNIAFYNEFLMRSKKDLRALILYNINHKNISGIKMQGSGRLTKRLTASRSITKFRNKGSLKNINSSFHNISTTMLRGYFKSNLQYMNINSSNRNGSFGMKTWISSY